jgi:predicted DsbA family dithiol-disulfide isomerase
MDKVMFMNQQFLAESDLLVMAEQVGLDVATFKTCLASPEADLAVRADADHGNKAGVDSTPSLFLSGIKPGGEFVRVKGDPEDVLALINAHLAGTPLP